MKCDDEWIEKKFPKVLHFIMSLKPCRQENLVAFYDQLLTRGVWHADEMSLRNAQEIDMFRSSQLSERTRFWADTDTYAELSSEYHLGNNPFRMLINEVGFEPGLDLVFGSDGMPHGAEAALNAALFPPLASQVLTLDEFVAGYCLPDEHQGYIDVGIDEAHNSISVKVIPS